MNGKYPKDLSPGDVVWEPSFAGLVVSINNYGEFRTEVLFLCICGHDVGLEKYVFFNSYDLRCL